MNTFAQIHVKDDSRMRVQFAAIVHSRYRTPRNMIWSLHNNGKSCVCMPSNEFTIANENVNIRHLNVHQLITK